MIIVILSFKVKNGWKLTFSKFLFTPIGLLDPVICKDIKCNKIITNKMKGTRKCREKNRFRVAFLTEKFPHNQITTIFPK